MTNRYHPALVVLHWVLAVLLLVSLGMGSLVLSEMPNTMPEKLQALQGHMVAGGLIFVLTVVRLFLRVKTRHPPAATTGAPVLDKLAGLAHWALYLLVFAMVVSGGAMAASLGLPAVVFGGQGTLPPDFHVSAARAAHGWLSAFLAMLILLHVAAALFHQFVRRDGLLSRMALGRRTNTNV